MNALAASLLMALGRTTLLLAAAALLVRLLLAGTRCSSPAVHRAAWCLVLLQGWLFLRLPVAIPWYESPATPADRASGLLSGHLLPRPQALSSRSMSPAMELQLGPTQLESSPADPEPLVPARAPLPQRSPVDVAPTSWPWSWPALAIAVWIAGMSILVARGLTGYVRFVRRLPPAQPVDPAWVRQWEGLLAEAGVRRAIPVRMTAGVGPILCRLPQGCQLLVPIELWRTLSPEGRLTVLRHELAHWRRGDTYKSLLVRLLALPHWFNPAAWWAARKFEETAEWACDLEAAGTDREHAFQYARTLLTLGNPSTQYVSYGPAARGRGLSVRVRRLLSTRNLEDSVMKKSLVITVALGLVVVCLLRFNLVAKESVADGPAAAAIADEQPPAKKPADQAPGILREEKPAEAKPANNEKVPLELLRYDGKSFAEWKNEWKTELKPERRAEAIKAFAAFGANGYGEEAAKAVLEVMRGMEMEVSDAVFDEPGFAKGEHVGNKLIKQSALAAFRRVLPDYRIPPEDAVKVLSRELKTGNRNGRMFAIFALRNMVGEAQAALPALRETFKNDEDPTVRCCAYPALADVAEWSGASASTRFELINPAELRGLMKVAEPEALRAVLNTLIPSHGATASSVFQVKPIVAVHGGFRSYSSWPPRELRPNAEAIIQVLLEALDSQRTAARYEAVWALGRMGREAKEAVPALVRAFKEGDPRDRRVIFETLAPLGASAAALTAVRFATIRGDEEHGPAFDPKTVIPELIQALDHRNPDDFRLMIEFFGRFGSAAEEVIPILQKAAKDEDEDVRRAAQEALKSIPRSALQERDP